MGGHYFFAKTFTFGRTRDTLEELEMKLTTGIVHNVVISFPAGAQRLTNVQISRGATTIFPRNQGVFYRYEDYNLLIADYWPLLGGESSLILKGFNTDDSKDHEILIALQVTDQELFFSQLGLLSRMDALIQQQRDIIGAEDV